MDNPRMKGNLNTVERQAKMPRTFLPMLLFLVIFGSVTKYGLETQDLFVVLGGFVLAAAVSQSVRVAQQWEKAIVLRLGKFHRLAGPGLFFVIPLIDTVPYWIDQRIHSDAFTAEQTLTKDNVPVDVDAILFWVVWDAEKAALEVTDYLEAVSWAAQTALRDVIGKTMLSDMLAGRENIDLQLQQIIDQRTEAWGIAVQSVEIRDVIIPEALQDAMSKEAQAERERRSRIILASAEEEIAGKMVEAARIYGDNEVAVKLKTMSILCESIKENGGLVVVPSNATDFNTLGTTLGLKNKENFKKAKHTEKPEMKGEEHL